MEGKGKKQKPKSKAKQSSITRAVGRLVNAKNKKTLGNALAKSRKIKGTSNLIAWSPSTNKFVIGNQSKISKELKTTPATLKSRLGGGKKEFQEIKGYVVLGFDNVEKLVEFKKSIVKDTPTIKRKTKPILEGIGLLEKIMKEKYKLELNNQVENKYWGTTEDRFSVSVEDNLSIDDIEGLFGNAISNVINKRKLGPKDKIRVVIEDPNLKFFVSTQLMNAEDMNGNVILDLIESVIESNDDWQITSETNINISTINIPTGAGNIYQSDFYNGWKGGSSVPFGAEKTPTITDEDPEQFLCKSITELKVKEQQLLKFNKKSIVRIKNEDNLCCARAIAVGIFRSKYGTQHNKYKQIYSNAKDTQTKTAIKLHQQSGVPLGECGIEEIKLFEEFTGYQITIIDGDFFNQVVYPDITAVGYKPPEDQSKFLYLYKSNNHYDLIASNMVAGFFSKDNFCHNCKKCYKNKGQHKCLFKCNMCLKTNCPLNDIPLEERKYDYPCEKCGRVFAHKECYKEHLRTTPHFINGVEVMKSLCDKYWKCELCKKLMSIDKYPKETHKCGDYECKNCNKIVGEDHKCYMFPKLLKLPSEKYIFFDFETDISNKSHEVMYSVSQYFDNPEPIIHETIQDFCIWAFQEKHKGYTFIAHNGRGYDYKFIIRWVFDNTLYKPFTIFAGQKIMCMSIQELKIRFIDSLSFLTMPLKAFPKTFGLKELKKGFFPHWFNILENRNYIGPIPDISYFKPDSFKKKDRDEFINWYEEKVNSNYVWNQAKEMNEYCISDVDILRRCCIKFRELYLEVANIDPFSYLTIASVCMAIYKYNYIDYSFPIRYEAFEEKWGHTGCMKGGDPSKQDPEYIKDKRAFQKITYKNVFREKKIAVFEYKNVEWFRQAFFGGRTNATKLIYNFKQGEEGKYSDITSLYPTVQFYDKYPKGHYKVKTETEIEAIDYELVSQGKYFGFINCKIEPPSKLYHPVLPHKTEKLIFDLNVKEGVWCSNEIQVACEKGYKILEIYEIRYFEETTTSLFKRYVKKFLKIKQEASGFPDWCNNEEDKQEYIRQYKKKQGILLEYHKIKKNPGLRAIAKLCLNSLWGKFGQRTNMSKTEIIDSKAKFIEIVSNIEYENVKYIELNTGKIEITYSVKDAFVPNDFNTNIVIACFTTSSARMRLYEALDYLNEQILYFDTDSCVYKYNPIDKSCNRKLNNGDLLGDWTDELEGVKMCGTFVSGGPKNYSFETDDGKYHTKVKGFNLNYEVGLRINHNSIIGLVNETLEDKLGTTKLQEELDNCMDYEEEDLKEEIKNHNKIAVSYDLIKRTKEHTCENFTQKKRYGLVYTKREILPRDEYGNYDTIPFGYNKQD